METVAIKEQGKVETEQKRGRQRKVERVTKIEGG